MTRERRAEVKRMARYFAAGMIENAEPMASGDFDDLSDAEAEVLGRELLAISRRIYPEQEQPR